MKRCGKRNREDIKFATDIFLRFYSNLEEIKSDGSSNLLLELMRRYRLEIETIQIVFDTIYKRDEREHSARPYQARKDGRGS